MKQGLFFAVGQTKSPAFCPLIFWVTMNRKAEKRCCSKNINMHKHEPKVAGGAFNPAGLFAFFCQIDYAN